MLVLTVVATVAGVLAAIVAVAAWLLPRSPRAKRPRLAEFIDSYQVAESVRLRLVESMGSVFEFDLRFDPVVATYEDRVSKGEKPPSYIFLRDPNGFGTDGIQLNAFGLVANNVENVLGWGGPAGIMLKGVYRVTDSGTGTGGVQWVALQAQLSG